MRLDPLLLSKYSFQTIKNKKTPQIIEEFFFVGLLGLEPRKTAPKTVVLPLHHRPIPLLLSECKFNTNFILSNYLFIFIEKTFLLTSFSMQVE